MSGFIFSQNMFNDSKSKTCHGSLKQIFDKKGSYIYIYIYVYISSICVHTRHMEV